MAARLRVLYGKDHIQSADTSSITFHWDVLARIFLTRSNAVKGGKAGRRKSSSTRAGGKPKPRGGKKSSTKHDWSVPPNKSDKKTTKLGANRVPDDN